MGEFFYNLNAEKRLSNYDSKFRGDKTKYRHMLLHFTDRFFFFFLIVLQTEGSVTAPHGAGLSVPSFHQHLLTSCLPALAHILVSSVQFRSVVSNSATP